MRNDTTADVDELVIGDVRLVVHPSGSAQMVRVRDPRLYMERAMAGDAVVSADEVSRKQLPFEFMLNALRLVEGFALRDFDADDILDLALAGDEVRPAADRAIGGDGEVRVALALLVRGDPEHPGVERGRLRDVVDVERELDACTGHDR